MNILRKILKVSQRNGKIGMKNVVFTLEYYLCQFELLEAVGSINHYIAAKSITRGIWYL
jgi:hypothetical protein